MNQNRQRHFMLTKVSINLINIYTPNSVASKIINNQLDRIKGTDKHKPSYGR